MPSGVSNTGIRAPRGTARRRTTVNAKKGSVRQHLGSTEVKKTKPAEQSMKNRMLMFNFGLFHP